MTFLCISYPIIPDVIRDLLRFSLVTILPRPPNSAPPVQLTSPPPIPVTQAQLKQLGEAGTGISRWCVQQKCFSHRAYGRAGGHRYTGKCIISN